MIIKFVVKLYQAITEFILKNCNGCKVKWGDKKEVKK